jgi:hypothetical protein
MPIPQTINQLISRFNENRASYSASTYNETQLRREFLDPFFEALSSLVGEPRKERYLMANQFLDHAEAVLQKV